MLTGVGGEQESNLLTMIATMSGFRLGLALIASSFVCWADTGLSMVHPMVPCDLSQPSSTASAPFTLALSCLIADLNAPSQAEIFLSWCLLMCFIVLALCLASYLTVTSFKAC